MVGGQQDIDIEQVVKQLREHVRRRNDVKESFTTANRVYPFADGQAALDLARLHSGYDVQDVAFTSHRAVVGSVVTVLKRILRKLLTPILERQVAYNAANTRAIAHIKECLEKLDRRQAHALQMVNSQLEALEHRQSQLADAEAQLREVRATQSQLRDEVLPAQSRLHDELTTQSQVLEGVRQSSQAARERIARAERNLRRILYTLQTGQPQDGRPAMKVGEETPAFPHPELELEFDYAGFEERFRGSEDEIKERQRIYLQYFKGRENIIDIGCGRGEFLELLQESGIQARGVDLDLDMVLLCRDKGLDVVRGDAFAYLGALPDASVGGVFAAQVIEHVHPRQVIELVMLCSRKLAPGSVLILETPNPKCLLVFAETFYKDPSHVQPIHPDTMQFLFEAVGFHDIELRFSAPVPVSMKIPPAQVSGADLERFNQGIERLNSLLFGFQDYAVVGRKGRATAHQGIISPGPDS